MNKEENDINSLAHTKWDCKYHIVFAPKYRRKVFYQEKREDIREIIRIVTAYMAYGDAKINLNKKRNPASVQYKSPELTPEGNYPKGVSGYFLKRKKRCRLSQ